MKERNYLIRSSMPCIYQRTCMYVCTYAHKKAQASHLEICSAIASPNSDYWVRSTSCPFSASADTPSSGPGANPRIPDPIPVLSVILCK